MYTIKDLDKEVTQEFAHFQAGNKAVIPKSWLIQTLLARHSHVEGHDADFALFTMSYAVTDRVEACFRRIKANEDTQADRQFNLDLPGFPHLQKFYLVKRDNESVAVSVWAMTDEEIRAKAEEHQAMGRGHMEHATELLRFMVDRGALTP